MMVQSTLCDRAIWLGTSSLPLAVATRASSSVMAMAMAGQSGALQRPRYPGMGLFEEHGAISQPWQFTWPRRVYFVHAQSSPGATKRNVEHFITHNGDLDFFTSDYTRSVDLVAVLVDLVSVAIILAAGTGGGVSFLRSSKGARVVRVARLVSEC